MCKKYKEKIKSQKGEEPKMEEKNKSKGKKGITLVSLVITTIVILILAGVAINLAMDEEGLIGKAEEAVESWNRAVGEESNVIKNILMKANEIEGGGTGGGGDDITYVGDVPVPNGYTASQISNEDSEAEGLVIYEIPKEAKVNWTNNEDSNGKNQSTITIEGNTTNLQETVNQYVWIPVEEINDMVMCKKNNVNSVCELIYDEEDDTLTCQTHQTTEEDLVGRLYTGTGSSTTDESGNEIHSYIINFEQTDQTYDENGYHEPNTVSDDVSNNLGIDQLKSDFTVMAKSVAKNGGFYISRYEVGEGGSSKKGQTVLTAASSDGTNYLGADTWYGLYDAIRNIEANKQMIWGCQYDQVIKFLKGREEDLDNGHSDRNLTDTNALSGQNKLDCMRNIYDLEGNHIEYTTGTGFSYGRVYRGSDYYSVGIGLFYPATNLNCIAPTSADAGNNYSARSTLYL